MNENCEHFCPKRAFILADYSHGMRVQQDFEQYQAEFNDLQQSIGNCSLKETLTGEKKDLKQQQQVVAKALLNASTERILLQPSMDRIEGCLGPFERISTNEVICGAEVRGVRLKTED